jgi:hypothetical protein
MHMHKYIKMAQRDDGADRKLEMIRVKIERETHT